MSRKIRFFGLKIDEKNNEEFSDNKEDVNLISTAIYEQIRSSENKLELKSLLKENKTITFNDKIKSVCATNNLCWVLLSKGSTIYRLDLIDYDLIEIPLQSKGDEVKDICCTKTSFFWITNENHLYQLCELTGNQKKIHEFPKHHKIKKIVAGAEHCLLLSFNGDVFSFGCGLRGVLGHGDVNSCENPKQIEHLAGLKIIDIAAGSYHSIAVSSFNDIYVWGWNTNGQLGIKKTVHSSFKIIPKPNQQVFTSPQIIDFLDDECESIKSVHCGAKHSLLRTESNRIFVCGLNNHGQLGLMSSSVDEISKFTEVQLDVDENTKIVCGFWSTILL